MPATGVVLPQNRFDNLRFGLPMLFHRNYTLGLPGNAFNAVANQTNPVNHDGGFAGIYQALMDFVTVVDFTQDGVNNDGNTHCGRGWR